MKPDVGPLFMSKVRVCAEGLEYNTESEVRLMYTLNYYSKVSCGTYA